MSISAERTNAFSECLTKNYNVNICSNKNGYRLTGKVLVQSPTPLVKLRALPCGAVGNKTVQLILQAGLSKCLIVINKKWAIKFDCKIICIMCEVVRMYTHWTLSQSHGSNLIDLAI